MERNEYQVWTQFYQEFADRLYDYREDRAVLIPKIRAVYHKIGMKLPKLEQDEYIDDIDPFTVFGLFNKGLTDENRVKIITGMAEAFSIQAEIPHSFSGIPVLNPMHATFYWFRDSREEGDIQRLWDVFGAALDYAGDESEQNERAFIRAYDAVLEQKGVKWNLSMGLYWVRPYHFMNLDSRNRWFILLPGKMPHSFTGPLGKLKEVPSGRDYLNIVGSALKVLDSGDCPYHNFPELSIQAWELSEAVNQGKVLGPDAEEVGEAVADQDVDIVRYWLYSPGANACMWDEFYKKGIMAIGWGEIGDLTAYDSKEEMKEAMKQAIDPGKSYLHSAYATWQFSHVMKPGDVVFAKRGMHTVIGKGVVSSEYRYEGERPDEYKHVRSVRWESCGEFEHPGQAALKTLTEITNFTEYVDKLLRLFEEPEETESAEKKLIPYHKEEFLSEVYVEESVYETLSGLLKRKKNLILQGAPGVGKTYTAKRLAYAMMGVKDPERVTMIQFHQSYSYEDFMMGFRPTASGGFELKTGPFYNFCKKAEIDGENPYFFIIDEINRGDLSKIFGELFMLLESDKRGIPLQLLYADEKFTIPSNVYLIGMMNTADRSLAMLDYALRRRFAFYELPPAFQNEGFRRYQAEQESEKLDRLLSVVEQLNEEITGDETLGRGFCIGHSYFCTKDPADDDWLNSVVHYELIPLLEEYWFDEPEKLHQWSGKLCEAIR